MKLRNAPGTRGEGEGVISPVRQPDPASTALQGHCIRGWRGRRPPEMALHGKNPAFWVFFGRCARRWEMGLSSIFHLRSSRPALSAKRSALRGDGLVGLDAFWFGDGESGGAFRWRLLSLKTSLLYALCALLSARSGGSKSALRTATGAARGGKMRPFIRWRRLLSPQTWLSNGGSSGSIRCGM